MDMSMSTSNDTTSTMSMSTMSMYFFNSQSTSLYSSSWTPSTTGQYAGTCVFLIILAIISRVLYVWRIMVEDKWHDKALNRRYIVVAGQEGEEENRLSEKVKADGVGGVLTIRGVEEHVRVIKTHAQSTEGKPWRLSVDLPRSLIFVVQAGVGYLLMLAVMTLNVGYFLSVLAGLFVAELVLGRYAPHAGGVHF